MKELFIDAERHQLNQIVQSLYHNALHDYIANANRRDVMDKLFDFFEKAEITLISKAQLKIYKELERLTIEANFLKPNSPIQPTDK